MAYISACGDGFGRAQRRNVKPAATR